MDDSAGFIQKMMELGIGMSMMQQMPAMMEGVLPKPPSTNNTPNPPSIENRQYFIVADNSQAGPFTEEELIKLIQNELIGKDTLVWKKGMSTWAKASLVPDINRLFIMSKIK